MTDSPPDKYDPNSESTFDFLNEARSERARQSGDRHQSTAVSPGARRKMPIIRKPVPVSESGAIRPPGFVETPSAGKFDEFDFLDANPIEARSEVEPGEIGAADSTGARQEPFRPASEPVRNVAGPSPRDGLLRRSLLLFSILLVACGAVLFVFDGDGRLTRWLSGDEDSATLADREIPAVGSNSVPSAQTDGDAAVASIDSAEAIPPAAGPRPGSLVARFLADVERIEALVDAGRHAEAQAQIDGLDRVVFGYGRPEFMALEERIASASGEPSEPPRQDESIARADAESQRLEAAARAAEEERTAEAERIVEEARRAAVEAERLAETARQAETERLAEAERQAEAEAARQAEVESQAEAARQAEVARVAEAAREAEAEAVRVAEAERQAVAERAAAQREAARTASAEAATSPSGENARIADAEATNALVSATAGSTPAQQAAALAAAREAARLAVRQRSVELEQRNRGTSNDDADAFATGPGQRAADRRATTLAADRAATDRRIAEQREQSQRNEQSGQSEEAVSTATDTTRQATETTTPAPRRSASEPERIETAALARQPEVPALPAIGDDDLQLVYSRFVELENAVERQDIQSIIGLTRPSGARIQQLLQVFENSDSLEARITNVSMRKADSEITGMLRIDSIRRGDGSRVRPPPGLEAVALSSTRDDSGWSALVW